MKRIIILLTFLASLGMGQAQVSTVQEGFEIWPLSGWSTYNLGAGAGWLSDFNATFHSGVHSAHPRIANNPVDAWMVSPQINVSNNLYELSFWDLNDDTIFYDHVSVLVSTGSGNPTSGAFTEIYTIPDTSTVWQQRTIDLSAYNGQNIYVAFRYEGTWHRWYVDDVVIAPNTFTDGALTTVVNPVDVSLTPGIENVIVTVDNIGTSIIDTVSISWEINGVPQTPYSSNTMNLASGNSTNLTLGSYNFNTIGNHEIKAILSATGDSYNYNDTLDANYQISTFEDIALIGITPEAMYPYTGFQDVHVLLENKGMNTLDVAEVTWIVDGVPQAPFSTSSLNLNPGETELVNIGQYNFSTGVYEISANLNALGDTSALNNDYFAYTAIDTFWESFEGRIFPPENWSFNFGLRDNFNFDIAEHGDYYYVAYADNNYFGIVTDTLYTPLLDITPGDYFNLYIKTSGFLAADHTLVWKNGSTGTVQPIQNIVSPTINSWNSIPIDISSAAGVNYIGITTSSSGIGESKIDMITSTAKLHVNNNDLSIVDGNLYFLAKENVNESFDCAIQNSGNTQVLGSDYSLKLVDESGLVLSTTSGINLNPGDETNLAINHMFTAIDKHRLHFELDFVNDENLNDNIWRASDVHVVPNTVVLNNVGEPGDRNSNFPFDAAGDTWTFSNEDLSQSLYTSTEVPVSGDIYGFVYKYDNLLMSGGVKPYPLKIWIEQTDTQNLSAGYNPYSNLILVYDDTLEILPGFEKEIYIPFNTPQLYTGINNILIQTYQYEGPFPPSIVRFIDTDITTSDIKTISSLNYTGLDPTVQPTSPNFAMHQNIPHTTFVIDPVIEYCAVNGTVYGTGSLPLSGASVSVDGTPISVVTDVNGNYTLPNLPYGTYDLTASIIAYNDSTITTLVNTPTFTQDFYLIERAQVSITAKVTGSNSPTIPLENVEILAIGYTTDNTSTDINGNFTLNNIFGVSEYSVSLSMYGYYDTTIIVQVTNTNIDLGTIILKQEFISPFDVNVNTGITADVYWKNPLKSNKIKLQNDSDVISHSFTNEPLEEVWMGNLFTITDTTTITDVEFVTDIYVNAIDFVSIDIFNSSEELIASSESFLIYTDTVLIIDIPNIVVYDNIYAMIHWKDNPVSTNVLAFDGFDTSITANTAVIKYPNLNIETLHDFLGGSNNGVPYFSALLRVHTLDDGSPYTNNEELTYNVYRGFVSEFPDVTNWDILNESPVTNLSYTDGGNNTIDTTELYRYAVETIYNEGLSEVTFSNKIIGIHIFEPVSILELGDIGIVTISIAPVPTENFITIHVQSEKETKKMVSIFNNVGQLIEVIDMGTEREVNIVKDLSSYSSGTYILNFDINGETISKKIIVNGMD